jgi:hypothetical protein
VRETAVTNCDKLVSESAQERCPLMVSERNAQSSPPDSVDKKKALAQEGFRVFATNVDRNRENWFGLSKPRAG